MSLLNHLFSGNSEQASQKSADSRQNFGDSIVFSPGHALCRLWELWSGKPQQELSTDITLLPDGSGCACLTVEDLGREKEHLRQCVTQAAQQRLQAISPDSPQSPKTSLDEAAFVFLSSDEMAAWLLLFPPVGQGRELTMSRLEQILAAQGVVSGINCRLLCKVSLRPQPYFQLIPIACGTAPVPGRDGSVTDRFPRSAEQASAVDELGQADYLSLNLVHEIQQDDVICEIVPPTPGIPGSTVTGKTLPAKDGEDPTIPQGRNTYLSADGRYLLAARQGHVEFSGRGFQVKPVLNLPDCTDGSPRSIKFLGDIHIHGDVCCGTSICASGNIQVDGVIESCTIEAGENIIVSSGVQGQNGAVLHAQRSVYAKYLEHCSVYARESIQADCIINSNLYSNGTVRVCTGRGAIIGGTVRASHTVSANIVGSKAERETMIILGGLPCEEAERRQVCAEVEKIDQAISDLQRQVKDPSDSKLSKLRLNLCVAKMKLEKFDKDLAAQFDADHCDNTRLLRCKIAYPGTVVTVDGDPLRIHREEHDCSIGHGNIPDG